MADEQVPSDDSWLYTGFEQEAPAPAATAPAPEAKAAEPPVTAPAEPAPEAPVQKPPVEEKGGTPPPPAEEPKGADKDAQHRAIVAERQAKLEQSVITLAEENAKLAKLLQERELEKSAPTPEELEAKAAAERDALLNDPSKFLAAREAEIKAATAKQVKEELAKSMGYKSTSDMEAANASTIGVRTLYGDKEAYPLMQDEAFRASVASDTNLMAVFKQYPKDSDPVEVLRNPQFWFMAYQRAALDHAVKTAGAPAKSAPAADNSQEPPTAITPGAPAPGATRPSPSAPVDDVWAQIESVGGGGLR